MPDGQTKFPLLRRFRKLIVLGDAANAKAAAGETADRRPASEKASYDRSTGGQTTTLRTAILGETVRPGGSEKASAGSRRRMSLFASVRPERRTSAEEKVARTKANFRAGLRRCGYRLFDLAALAALLAAGTLLYVRLYGEYVLTSSPEALIPTASAAIEDRQGQIVWRSPLPGGGGYREIASSAEIPPLLKQAFVAVEDRRFERHAGIDYTGIARAAAANLRNLGAAEGGSGITQQLARGAYLSRDKTLARKLNEASIALALERHYSKDQILTMYLNEIYMGRGQYGVKAAARRYFGTADLSRLELWQAAMLAGIPKAPSAYNPVDDPGRAEARTRIVLGLMAEQGLIDAAEADAAGHMAAAYVPPPFAEGAAGTAAYASAALREAARQTGLSEEALRGGGYRIETGLDAGAQSALAGVFAEDAYFPPDMNGRRAEAAMVVVDHRDGEVRALAGAREDGGAGLNRAVDMKRQPGSAFKPIIAYGPALESGRFSPDSVLPDAPQTYGGYSPRNAGGVYRGSLTMTEALTHSVNGPAVWLLSRTGIPQARQFAAGLGIVLGPEDEHLAVALGGLREGLSPLELAQAYAAIANGGKFRPAHLVRAVVDAEGREIYRFDVQAQTRAAMSPSTSAALTAMLRSAVENGTGRAAAMPGRAVAGKTGTVALALGGAPKAANRDVWFAGFTSEWTAAVWVGFDRTDPEHYLTVSGSAAAALFRTSMEAMFAASANRP